MAQNDIRDSLESDLYRTESERAAKLARLDVVVMRIAGLRREVDSIDKDAGELRRLSAEITSAESVHATYVQEREEARIALQTVPGVTNVQVVNWASMPERPPLSADPAHRNRRVSGTGHRVRRGVSERAVRPDARPAGGHRAIPGTALLAWLHETDDLRL